MNELQALQNVFRAAYGLRHTTVFDQNKEENIRKLVLWLEVAEKYVDYPHAPPIDLDKIKKTRTETELHQYEKAKALVAANSVIKASLLRKKLGGYNRPSAIAELLEFDGFVSPPDNRGTRTSLK